LDDLVQDAVAAIRGEIPADACTPTTPPGGWLTRGWARSWTPPPAETRPRPGVFKR
jgi:hypothetical protein